MHAKRSKSGKCLLVQRAPKPSVAEAARWPDYSPSPADQGLFSRTQR
jgi:hypothetical protein